MEALGRQSSLDHVKGHVFMTLQPEPVPIGQTTRDLAQLLEVGNALHKAGDFAAAGAQYIEVLRLDPRHFTAHFLLGVLNSQQEDFPEAEANFRHAFAINPRSPLVNLNLAIVLGNQGKYDGCFRHVQLGLRFAPELPELLFHGAFALYTLRRFGEALDWWNRYLALNPTDPKALMNLGATLAELKRPAEALVAFDRALTLKTDWPELLRNRATTLVHLGRTEEALATLDSALKMKPHWPLLHLDQSRILHLLGRHREAIAACERILVDDPSHAEAHSKMIDFLDYLPEASLSDHQAARQAYYEQHGAQFAQGTFSHPNDRDPDRRLVLGFMSHSFQHSATGSIILAMLRRHSRANFQINLYSNSLIEDHWTKLFQGQADVWRQTTLMPDEDLARQIREDQVDILIDLSGHTEGNRLLVFARKPAPIQVSGWGHAAGTGVRTIDYLISDPVAIPPEDRHLFAEEVVDLPCNLIFEAPSYAPPVALSPLKSRGFVTFGSMNRYTKITPETMRLWARILNALPNSRILFKDLAFDDAEIRLQVLGTFGDLGVSVDRIDFLGYTSRMDHMAAYSNVDILLDPYPLNGGITTTEALWMGVPVITKLGQTMGGRLAGAILHALGFGDWVAHTEEEYLQIALRHAGNQNALAALRAEIRSRILASPAGNPERYTHAVETAYRSMWKRWLAQKSPLSSPNP